MRILTKNDRTSRTLKVVVLVALIGILAVAAASCKWTIGVVRGSGDIESEEREVSGFNEIQLTGIGNLIIEQGDEEGLVVEADDNIIGLIETEVRGDALHIGFKRGVNVVPTTNIKFYLKVKDLDRIDLSGLGDIDCDKFETDDIEFNLSGSGDIDFEIAAESIETNVSGLGDINLSGKVDSHRVQISGSGKYDAEELESKDCEVEISGLGSATVNASDDLDIEINGVGNVYYKGDPHVSQHISGLGRIKSLD
ncbi:MAG: head GIN domain-containing protein [Candidatus Humimicrobiaceae bacterium]